MPPTTDPAQPVETINSVWATAGLDQSTFITLPSGQTCRARPIGMEGILASGLLGDADSLTGYVGKQHVRRVRGAKGVPDADEVDAKSVMKDPAALKKIVFLVDRLVPQVVVSPVVHLHFEFVADGDTRMIPPEERVKGQIYTDMIGLQDKMYLFNFAMAGVIDLETFRKQSEDVVGTVDDGQGVPNNAQRPHARRQRPKRRAG